MGAGCRPIPAYPSVHLRTSLLCISINIIISMDNRHRQQLNQSHVHSRTKFQCLFSDGGRDVNVGSGVVGGSNDVGCGDAVGCGDDTVWWW